ncbi:AAA family ATPase [Chloroflexota bacterium]
MIDERENCQVQQTLNGGLYFYWLALDVYLVIDRISENGRYRAITAEVSVNSPPSTPILSQVTVNVSSDDDRRRLVYDLVKMAPEFRPWDNLIDYAFSKTILHYRQGEPVVSLANVEFQQKIDYLVEPILGLLEPTIIFAKGGKGKTYLACLISVIAQNGVAFFNLIPRQTNVLFLDYETTAERIKRRCELIMRGLSQEFQYRDGNQDILYQRGTRPLADDLEGLQQTIETHQIGLLVVDSLGYAIGGDTIKEENVLQFITALRILKVTALLLDHESKDSEGEAPYGSVYKYNGARALFQLQNYAEPVGNKLTLKLSNRKTNDGPLMPPFGYQMTFHHNKDDSDLVDEISWTESKLSDIPELASDLPLRPRIKELLLSEGLMGIDDIAEMLGAAKASVKAKLYQYKDKVFYQEGKKWGVLQK